MALGMSVNEYLYALVCDDLAAGESRLGKKKQGFSEKQKRMMEKWQIPRKYYEMIQDLSYTKEEGYFIYLLVCLPVLAYPIRLLKKS